MVGDGDGGVPTMFWKTKKKNKAIAMMRRKAPRSENIYLIENHCQANISK